MPTNLHSPSELRERVSIYSDAGVADGYRGRSVAWTLLATVWAKVKPISGREIEIGPGQQAEVSTLIVIRYRSDVTAAKKATVRGVDYNIRSCVDPDLRRTWLEMLCDRGAAT